MAGRTAQRNLLLVTAIFLYDLTANMAQPWLKAGHDCVCVDIGHEGGPWNEMESHGNGTLYKHRADLNTWVPPHWLARADVKFLAAFPPCTDLAVSGARWFKGKGLGRLSDAIRLFERAAFWAEWFGAPYLIENPASTISTYWRKPDYTFHPHEYAGFCAEDTYVKRTCLWTGNGFTMPPVNGLHGVKPDERIHRAPQSPERAAFRSATPKGFAEAVFRHVTGATP